MTGTTGSMTLGGHFTYFIDRIVTVREEDDLQVRPSLTQPRCEVETIQIRQEQICNQQVEGFSCGVRRTDCLGAVTR